MAQEDLKPTTATPGENKETTVSGQSDETTSSGELDETTEEFLYDDTEDYNEKEDTETSTMSAITDLISSVTTTISSLFDSSENSDSKEPAGQQDINVIESLFDLAPGFVTSDKPDSGSVNVNSTEKIDTNAEEDQSVSGEKPDMTGTAAQEDVIDQESDSYTTETSSEVTAEDEILDDDDEELLGATTESVIQEDIAVTVVQEDIGLEGADTTEAANGVTEEGIALEDFTTEKEMFDDDVESTENNSTAAVTEEVVTGDVTTDKNYADSQDVGGVTSEEINVDSEEDVAPDSVTTEASSEAANEFDSKPQVDAGDNVMHVAEEGIAQGVITTESSIVVTEEDFAQGAVTVGGIDLASTENGIFDDDAGSFDTTTISVEQDNAVVGVTQEDVDKAFKNVKLSYYINMKVWI